ncbi:MAG: 3-hydroxybutyrate oligomer hydrolase family protein [Burkholderiaceae bacterium]
MRFILFSLAISLAPGVASAQSRCDQVMRQLAGQLADAVCFESADLTTTNPATTPQNNSLPGLPPFAFTPQTDRSVIAPSAGKRPPITKVVPGVQIQARFSGDATGQGRFLLRLPNDWNGGLVVAGASGTRSEFNGDFAWSDYVVQQGYAYASQNKGVLNLYLSTAADPLACRLNPDLPVYVHFYDNDPGQQFSRWRDFMVLAADVARRGVKAHYRHAPRFTYAVGTSNGGYQVRRAVETAPELFDGGVDWEGTFVDPHAPNLLTDLPPAILNFPDYVASGYASASTAAKNIRAAGYPPDLLAGAASMWRSHSDSFWEVTQCQWQKRLDPTYDTYVDGTGTYNYVARLSSSDVGAQMASFATTGKIKRPLITVAGTMDALLPIDHHARAYARLVKERDSGETDRDRNHGHGRSDFAAYRLYEVQNGNHLETLQDTFSELELIQPHAQRAFDLLVRHVEQRTQLPPDQCIGRGGLIVDAPSAVGHCASLLAP